MICDDLVYISCTNLMQLSTGKSHCCPNPSTATGKSGCEALGGPRRLYMDTLRALKFEKYIVGSYVCKSIYIWLVGSDGFRLHFFNVGKILIWYMAVLSLILFFIGFLMFVCIYCSSFQILGGKFTWLVPFIWMRLYADSNVLLVALCISRLFQICLCSILHQGFSFQPLGNPQLGEHVHETTNWRLFILLSHPITADAQDSNVRWSNCSIEICGLLVLSQISVGSTNKATFLQEGELFCMWHNRDIITFAEISYFSSYCPCLECPKIGFIWKKSAWWFGTWLLFSI